MFGVGATTGFFVKTGFLAALGSFHMGRLGWFVWGLGHIESRF
jgi:hypothetical protein